MGASTGINLSRQDISVTKTSLTIGEGLIYAAILIIGCLALVGKLNGIVAGGCAIGLASAALIVNIIRSKAPNRSWVSVVAAIGLIAIIIIGSLALRGIVSHDILAKVMVGCSAGLVFLTAATLSFCACLLFRSRGS